MGFETLLIRSIRLITLQLKVVSARLSHRVESERLSARARLFAFRLVLKYGFKKVAKKSDTIRVDDIGLAFRHAGQNPSENTIKDMIEKAKALKKAQQRDDDDYDEGK